MVLLGGPVAEYLFHGFTPARAIRFPKEYEDENSDTTRIQRLVKRLRGGKDDRRYQLALQNECVSILRESQMWNAITCIAEQLCEKGEITGEECEEVFNRFGVPEGGIIRSSIADGSVTLSSLRG